MSSKSSTKIVIITFLIPILTSGINGIILQKEFELMLNRIDLIFSTKNLKEALKLIDKQDKGVIQPNTPSNNTDMVFRGFLVESHDIISKVENEFSVNSSLGEIVFNVSEVIDCPAPQCKSFKFLKPAILINEQLIVGDGAVEMFECLNEIQPCLKKTSIIGKDYFYIITFYECQLHHGKLDVLTRILRQSKYYGRSLLQHLNLDNVDHSSHYLAREIVFMICVITLIGLLFYFTRKRNSN